MAHTSGDDGPNMLPASCRLAIRFPPRSTSKCERSLYWVQQRTVPFESKAQLRAMSTTSVNTPLEVPVPTTRRASPFAVTADVSYPEMLASTPEREDEPQQVTVPFSSKAQVLSV